MQILTAKQKVDCQAQDMQIDKPFFFFHKGLNALQSNAIFSKQAVCTKMLPNI